MMSDAGNDKNAGSSWWIDKEVKRVGGSRLNGNSEGSLPNFSCD
jgi:hypothetical protein